MTNHTHTRLISGKTVSILGAAAALLIQTGCASSTKQANWGYDGARGPAHWSELNPDSAVCADGKEQSPVDIPAGAPINPAKIKFHYQPSALNIVNNGHTIQVNYDQGSSIKVEGKRYELLQFHFHALSEHTIDGEHSEMEAHFVHQSSDGEYAVVGVLLNRGAANRAFAPTLKNLPAKTGMEKTVEGVSVNAIDMLPRDRSYYRYDGSFTTPPCTEGVRWFVMASPVMLSGAQIDAFASLYDNNYRPVQPMYDRRFLVRRDG